VQIGVGLTDAPPRSARNTYLIVNDLEAACQELADRGISVTDIRHRAPDDDWQSGWAPGVQPNRRHKARFAEFADPDGNTWVLQEIGFRASIGR
jgi:catechol 2,3-dioxygenase-like lactoylglutathione lyase family enzyme